MNIPFVDLHAQYLSIKSEIDAAIAEVIAESSFVRGRHVEGFEKAWAKVLGVKHCVSCGNGTDALYISLRALGLKPGDEVITTAHTWISTSETITQAGGRVVFCDTDKDTFTIDPELIEAKITSRTVGIIPVHLYGQAADMDPIMAIARKHDLWVIEDSAQAHLAKHKGRMVGTFGNIATFSFYPGKNLGAYGDAGCLVTNDDQLAAWATAFARHGGKNEHVMEGICSRMDGLQAAVLNVKLPHLPAWTEARRAVARRYDELLSDIGGVITPKVRSGLEHVYHLYVICARDRDALRKQLTDAGITTVVNYPKALPFYSAYAHLQHVPEDFPVAYANQSQILSLPIYPELGKEMVAYVTDCIRGFYEKPKSNCLSPPSLLKYVLITAARNEERLISHTLASVIGQTRRPKRWVIVDDGSSDATADIVRKYSREHPWIALLHRPARIDRTFTGKAEAVNAALEQMKEIDFEVVGNLDADVSFEPDYMEFLLQKLSEDSELGVAGTPFTQDGDYDSSRDSFEGENYVAGPCQIFRRECFQEIGGYVPNRAGGVDWIAVMTARMKGWKVRCFPEKRFHHHRPLGTAERNQLRALFSYGEKDYYLGGSPLWQLFRVAYRMAKKPFVVGGLSLLAGYVWASVRRVRRAVSPELMQFHRMEQMRKLKAIIGRLMRLKRINSFSLLTERS